MGNNTIRISLLLIPISGLFIITFILAACGGSTTSAPTTTITTTTTSETPIPSDYTTYTSEGLFSISYPSDWELLLMLVEPEAKELIAIIESGSPVAESPNVFYAGAPLGEGYGYDPFVEIWVDKSPVVNQSLDSVVEEMMLGFRKAPDYIEFSQVKTAVDNREAVILDFQWLPDSAETPFRYLVMTTLVGKTSWQIMSFTSLEMFNNYEDDLYAVINSFRMLN
jgi:hypothetical protein